MPLRSLHQNPFRTILRRMPRVPEASPEATLRNLLRNPFRNIASKSATRPEGKPKDPFEICLMSRKPHRETLRSFPRRVPRVPEYPRPGEPFRMPPELATCSECRSRDNISPDAVRKRHASRSPHREPNREIPRPPSGSFPKETRVPECLSRKTPSRIFFEPATCPETLTPGVSPGDCPSTPHVPSTQEDRTLPEAPECA